DSHVGDLCPMFSVRHGDVDAVVRNVIAGAESRTIAPVAHSDVDDHSHDELVVKMVTTLERAASRPARDRERSPVKSNAAVPEFRFQFSDLSARAHGS